MRQDPPGGFAFGEMAARVTARATVLPRVPRETLCVAHGAALGDWSDPGSLAASGLRLPSETTHNTGAPFPYWLACT